MDAGHEQVQRGSACRCSLCGGVASLPAVCACQVSRRAVTFFDTQHAYTATTAGAMCNSDLQRFYSLILADVIDKTFIRAVSSASELFRRWTLTKGTCYCQYFLRYTKLHLAQLDETIPRTIKLIHQDSISYTTASESVGDRDQ